jgi:DNA (cytosine-5)-methyltransferase 1
MRCGHLFNGIGGFPLAASWMGWENIMHCEIDPFCNRIMNHHFPNSFQHEDIRTTGFTIWRGRIDLLTGGFPCQDISIVGKGKGITGQKSGLWSEAYRAIDEIRPKIVVLENSTELLKKGFENILYPLSEIGYNAEWECFKAIDVGYPHIRERVFVLAYADGVRWKGDYEDCGILPEVFNRKVLPNKAPDILLSLVRPDRSRNFENLQLDNGFPGQLDKESIKAFGNAIVPQIAFQIFKAIEQYEADLF